MDSDTGSGLPGARSKNLKKSLICCILLLAFAGCMWAKSAANKGGIGLEKVEMADENCVTRERLVIQSISRKMSEPEDNGTSMMENTIVKTAYDIDAIDDQELIKTIVALLGEHAKGPLPYKNIRAVVLPDDEMKCREFEPFEKCITLSWAHMLDAKELGRKAKNLLLQLETITSERRQIGYTVREVRKNARREVSQKKAKLIKDMLQSLKQVCGRAVGKDQWERIKQYVAGAAFPRRLATPREMKKKPSRDWVKKVVLNSWDCLEASWRSVLEIDRLMRERSELQRSKQEYQASQKLRLIKTNIDELQKLGTKCKAKNQFTDGMLRNVLEFKDKLLAAELGQTSKKTFMQSVMYEEIS